MGQVGGARGSAFKANFPRFCDADASASCRVRKAVVVAAAAAAAAAAAPRYLTADGGEEAGCASERLEAGAEGAHEHAHPDNVLRRPGQLRHLLGEGQER